MRFTEKKMSQTGSIDFIPRDRSRYTTHLLMGFLFTTAIAIMTILYGDMVAGKAGSSIVMTLMLIILCFFCIINSINTNDTVLNTEFQNLMFASATNLGLQFTAIIKRDGTVVYTSEGFKDLFDNFNYPESQILEGFYIEGRIPQFDQDKITNALLLNEAKSIRMKVASNEGIIDMVIGVQPLPRPAGYYLISGRKYYTQRNDKATKILSGSEVTSENFQFVLDYSPVGHFVCDEFGRLIYMNPALQALSGYSEEDILANRMHLSDIMTYAAGSRIGVEYEYQDMNADMLLIRRSGDTARVSLSMNVQKVAGRAIALVGTITHS